MATVNNALLSQANPVSGSAISGNTTSGASQSTSGATDPLANESTFLTLLVSQLKNQNPTSPMDGTTFVTQLAQFSDLEQNLAMRNDLDALKSKYVTDATATTATIQTNAPASS